MVGGALRTSDEREGRVLVVEGVSVRELGLDYLHAHRDWRRIRCVRAGVFTTELCSLTVFS